MDAFATSVRSLFPVHLILSCSDRCNQLLDHRFHCSAGSLLRLLPDLSEITGCIRDPTSSIAHPVTRLNIQFTDLDSLSAPASSAEAVRRRLQQCVASFASQENVDEWGDEATPWFEAWKQLFLLHQERSDHEFVGAFFGSVFILLSDELDRFKEILTQLQSRINGANIKLFFSSFMRFFIILNPLSLRSYDIVSLEPSFRDFVSSYGISNCFWFDILDDDIVLTEDNDPNHLTHDPHPPDVNTQRLADPLSPISEQAPIGMNGRMHVKGESMDEEVRKSRCQKPVVSQGLLLRSEQCLRQMIESTLIPWTEKQMRFLYDAISARKGIRKSIKQLFGMAPTSGLMRGPTTCIYKLESDEMQNRKLADMSMSLGLYELAFKFYHTARDEFRADGACLYFAGASEMTAVTAFLINRFQKHYFEQAISTYQDVCKASDLASRCTLLATDCMRQLYPNEAALFFIRMTSEDSDLRSGLFLEQAAKCFQESVVPRTRKASFHYVLAGHRYNKCGLKRHSLHCYRRFASKNWTAAIEHVDFTVARLFIHLSVTSPDKSSLRAKGLELLRTNSEKVLFFQELLAEIAKRELDTPVSPNFRYALNVPFIKSLKMEPIEGSIIKKGTQTCFRGEPVTIHFQLYTPFALRLDNLRLVTNNATTTSSRTCVDLAAESEKCVTLSVQPEEEADFEIVGMEYETANELCARLIFEQKVVRMLRMVCVKALPPVHTSIQIGTNTENVDAVEMLAGETTQLFVTVNLVQDIDWMPSRIFLQSDAEVTDTSNTAAVGTGVSLNFGVRNCLQLRAPCDSKSHSFFFRVEYWDDVVRERRSITKHVQVYVRECLVVEGLVEGVVSLRNTLSSGPVTLQSQNQVLHLWPGLTAHILLRDSSIKWSSGTRQGFLSIDSWQ